MKKLTIIDYGASNLRSIYNAFKIYDYQVNISNQAEEIIAADKVIFPGVGAAGSALSNLKKKKLEQLIPRLTQPVLGICLGMQLLGQYMEESEELGLGIFDAKIERISEGLKIPHMGWNEIFELKGELFKSIPEMSYLYFVHSYRVVSSSQTVANCSYGSKFSAALQKDNFYGLQFHPEKSAKLGAQIIQNFLAI